MIEGTGISAPAEDGPASRAGRLPGAVLILNPAARGGRAGAVRDRVLRALEGRRADVDVRVSAGPGDALRLAREAAARGVERVIAAGGDGTVHEVVNGMAGSDSVMGIVPLGSGNDLGRLLGLRPRRVAEALDAALGPTVVRLDVGVACVHGTSVKELFVNQCGFALEPEVVRRLRPGKLFGGSTGYAAAAARALAAFRPRRLTLRADALRVEAEPLLLEVANAPYAGGGFRLAPRADPRDGRLDVCLVERLTWPRLVFALPRALSGTHLGLKGVTYLRAQSVEVRSGSGGPLAFHLDGELREAAGGGVDLGVLPRGLRVAVPEGALR